MATGPNVKFAAEVAHVREVSLLGSADLAYWQAHLKDADLAPLASGGRAQILIIAADMKYMGARFREVSVNVLTAATDRVPMPGAFLVRAFNSCRFFAFCERVFFSTPYFHAAVHVSATVPAVVDVAAADGAAFRVEMHADGREPARRGPAGWAGPVFLPGRRGWTPGSRWFYARLSGDTRSYAFLPEDDAVTIKPTPGCAVLQALADSHFAGHEWSVRDDAVHGKSKTYPRSDLATRL